MIPPSSLRPDLTYGDLDEAIGGLVERPVDDGVSLALVIRQGGEVIAERYGTQPGNLFDPEPVAVDANTPLGTWCVAESIVHAAVGVLVGDGRLDVDSSAPVAEWRGTEQESITLLDLLEMRSGLRVADDGTVDAVERPAGMEWSHSPGTTRIICRVLGDVVGGDGPEDREHRMREFLDERLFGPTGMASIGVDFDATGTWVGSSQLLATAGDLGRFGEMYLRDGTVGGERVLPAGWPDHGRVAATVWPDGCRGYGRHWWIWTDHPGSLVAQGSGGQYVIVLPERDAVIVHLGRTDVGARSDLAERLRGLIDCL